jgi:hypothetical protein
MGLTWEIVIMFTKKISLLATIFAIFILNASGDEIKEIVFASPIIYRPVIEMASSSLSAPLNRQTPTVVKPFEITMKVSPFAPRDEDRIRFNDFRQITFKEIDNIKILVFKKDDLIQELHVIKANNHQVATIKYVRDLDSLFSKISIAKDSESYLEKTRKTVTALLKQEDFLANLPFGEHTLLFELRLLEDIALGKVGLSSLPCNHKFSYYKFKLENSALRVSLKTPPLQKV